MKKILISIKPKWVAKILNGEKTIEVRKTAPKCALPATVYIYCTKKGRIGETLIKHAFDGIYRVGNCVGSNENEPLNGKIVAKFTLSKIERVVSCVAKDWGDDPWEMRYSLRLEESDTAHNDDRLMDEGGFEYLSDICDYLGFDFPISNSGFGERPDFEEGVVYGYAWHISDLEIFDEPKELSEFHTLKCIQKKWPCNIKDVFGVEECREICKLCKPLDKAPRSWCYVEEHEWWEL